MRGMLKLPFGALSKHENMKEGIGFLEDFISLIEKVKLPRLFRGQSNSMHSVLPGIGRSHPEYVATPELEEALLEQFKARAVPYLRGPHPKSEWEWLILAQHHGLKTRLLDWTTDWRVALYFATLPHEEMFRVPFSIFIATQPEMTKFSELPANPFKCEKNYFFQPPHLVDRIQNQQAYFSVHQNPYIPMDGISLLQFSFYPFREHRRQIAKYLAELRVTAAEIFPGLDGICKFLVDEPRIGAQLELNTSDPVSEEWHPAPPIALGKTVRQVHAELRSGALRVLLDWKPLESLIGIPCYKEGKIFGYLKTANKWKSKFYFISPNGSETICLSHDDEDWNCLTLHNDHVDELLRSGPQFKRKIKIKLHPE
jgi:hypothetical protein